MALPLLSTVHVNVNCSDLERSLTFYRDVVGLEPLSHTAPPPQDGDGFGLVGRVRWDAHLLHDARGVSGPAVDLLEWKTPAPVGRPSLEAQQPGIYRVCLTAPDLDALETRLRALGHPPLQAPQTMDLGVGDVAPRFLCVRDPDGACVEFIEQPGATRLLHVNVNCRDLDRSSAWYREVLGVQPLLPRVEPEEVDGRGLGLPGSARFRAEFLSLPDRPDLVLDLIEWREPSPEARPARVANQLGWFRIAYLVGDAEACCSELDRLGVEHSGPSWLEMGPDVPVEGLRAVFFRDPDGTCLELIETPVPRGAAR